MVTVCPSQFATRRTLFHVLVGCGLLMLKVSRLKLPVIWLLVSMCLDINNTIDHRPEGDEKWFLENEKTVTQFCRKLAAERPLKDIRDEYNYPKKKGIKDECSRLLEASTMKSRRGFA